MHHHAFVILRLPFIIYAQQGETVNIVYKIIIKTLIKTNYFSSLYCFTNYPITINNICLQRKFCIIVNVSLLNSDNIIYP